MNRYIIGVLFFMLVCSCISTILCYYWMNSNYISHWYLGYTSSDSISYNTFLNFFAFFLLYNAMIPISLIVSLEFVKVF